MRTASFAYAIIQAVAAVWFAVTLAAGCTDGRAKQAPTETERAVVSGNGTAIAFPPGLTGLQQIRTTVTKKGSALIPVLAPARVVANVVSTEGGPERVVLFDSPDVTSLYSQYEQASASVERSSKNMQRIKDMYAHQSATGKDLNEAESDLATARALLTESISKLRAVGFNTSALDSAPIGTVWLISDVPEAQLNEVQKNEEVDVYFASFPGRKFTGRAEAIADVVDPVTRTVKVRVAMHNAGGKLLPGMFARVDFGDPMQGVIVLPTSAIVTVEGVDYAFVEIAEGKFQRRRLTLANSGEKDVVVLHGLEDGERVVIGGAMLLKGLSFGY